MDCNVIDMNRLSPIRQGLRRIHARLWWIYRNLAKRRGRPSCHAGSSCVSTMAWAGLLPCCVWLNRPKC